MAPLRFSGFVNQPDAQGLFICKILSGKAGIDRSRVQLPF
jgi:hypothetical protein